MSAAQRGARSQPGAPGAPPVAYVGARLLDPERGTDAPGGVIVADGRIADFGPHLARAGAVAAIGAHGMEVHDCAGACLAPGLVDIRVQAREPGEEHKETLASAADAGPEIGDLLVDDDQPARLVAAARRVEQTGAEQRQRALRAAGARGVRRHRAGSAAAGG